MTLMDSRNVYQLLALVTEKLIKSNTCKFMLSISIFYNIYLHQQLSESD